MCVTYFFSYYFFIAVYFSLFLFVMLCDYLVCSIKYIIFPLNLICILKANNL